jgi:hypothetical protein
MHTWSSDWKRVIIIIILTIKTKIKQGLHNFSPGTHTSIINPGHLQAGQFIVLTYINGSVSDGKQKPQRPHGKQRPLRSNSDNGVSFIREFIYDRL